MKVEHIDLKNGQTVKLFTETGTLINRDKMHQREVMKLQGLKTGKQFRKFIKRLRQSERRRINEGRTITSI